jgi:hypothetical protein
MLLRLQWVCDSLMPKAKLRQDNIRSLEYVGTAQGESQCIYRDPALVVRKNSVSARRCPEILMV